jgi:CBS domain containing-hemolysin-like protein
MAIIAWLLVWVKFSGHGFAGRIAVRIAPVYSKLLSFIGPLLRPVAQFLPADISLHTGLYEKRDLLELLGSQNKQIDNRIPESDLKIAYNSLTFGDKTVGKVMTPRRSVKMVGTNDTVGPLLMDDLHKSGFSRFPVVKDSIKVASPQIVGTLYLNNLVGYEGNGKVKDLARKEVYFINEDSTLHLALSAFLKTHHHLLIVVNSFEEMVGVITLEDVLEQILGKQIIDEFDNYESLRAVAAIAAQQEARANGTIKPAAS